MATYHCPYCGALIQHRPRLSGERVACSKCKGAYFEPTDPLPGIKPEKAPAFENQAAADTLAASVASGGEQADASSEIKDVSKCEPGDMVAELASRGQNAILLFWNPANPADAGLAYSKNLSRQQADDQLILVAAHVMQQRWPDLHQLILNRLAGS